MNKLREGHKGKLLNAYLRTCPDASVEDFDKFIAGLKPSVTLSAMNGKIYYIVGKHGIPSLFHASVDLHTVEVERSK